jgi:hypothetical protein
MKLQLRSLTIIALLLSACAGSKLLPLTNDQVKANLKKHISTLASDDFEGRDSGSKGEEKSSAYIIKEFKSAKLKGKGESGFLQPFKFNDGATYGSSTQLVVNNSIFKVNEDFYPLAYSGNNIVTNYISKLGYGILDESLKRNDYLGKINIAKRIFLLETGTPDGNTPHGKFGEWADLRKKIDLAIVRGAAAIIFINSDTTNDDPKADWKNHISPVAIPVIFAKGKAASLLRDSVITNCTVGTEVIHIEREGHNVIGYIDNKATSTIVIGAHYDHLGYGEEGSLYRGERAIHNGADDNASGTGALIELAKFVKSNGLKNKNYFFIAFSGEEKGLLGSNYFVKHPTINLKEVSCMINMDMLGRLKPDEKTLIINGTGTSPSWKNWLDSMHVNDLKFKTTESGVGPSDHTSFYLQDIPVLHFFSGTHEDYHKPSDDENKINYDGEMEIIEVIKNILVKADAAPKMTFTKTKDDSNEDAPKFKVTLGVVPDYAFEGEGMRIDGVSDGKPASHAGLLAGDVVIQLGENKVVDMMSYMKALGKFSKGQTTKVKFIRGKVEMEKDITF